MGPLSLDKNKNQSNPADAKVTQTLKDGSTPANNTAETKPSFSPSENAKYLKIEESKKLENVDYRDLAPKAKPNFSNSQNNYNKLPSNNSNSNSPERTKKASPLPFDMNSNMYGTYIKQNEINKSNDSSIKSINNSVQNNNANNTNLNKIQYPQINSNNNSEYPSDMPLPKGLQKQNISNTVNPNVANSSNIIKPAENAKEFSTNKKYKGKKRKPIRAYGKISATLIAIIAITTLVVWLSHILTESSSIDETAATGIFLLVIKIAQNSGYIVLCLAILIFISLIFATIQMFFSTKKYAWTTILCVTAVAVICIIYFIISKDYLKAYNIIANAIG